MRVDWTPEKVDALRRMHAERFTFSQIASMISRDFGDHVSRNAVIGKASRIGLTGGKPKAPVKPRVKATPRQHPGNIRRKAAARKREAQHENEPLPKRQPETVPIIAPTRFADLRPDQCRFPMTAHLDPTGPDMPCCGAPVIDRFAPEGKREATHCQFHFNQGGVHEV